MTTALSPSVAALQATFGDAITRAEVSCGDTIVYVAAGRNYEILKWLQQDLGQHYDYLVDLTAVEYRDRERAIEVVYQLWSMDLKRLLRVKVALDKAQPLQVASVTDLWAGADWMEREVWDMFGIRFIGHPDLRRILMWENYAEGHPLRKDFPLRGRFSRSEQTRRALSGELDKHYSLEELSITEAEPYLPKDVKQRLAGGPG